MAVDQDPLLHLRCFSTSWLLLSALCPRFLQRDTLGLQVGLSVGRPTDQAGGPELSGMTGTGPSEDAEPVPFLFISFRVTTMNQKVIFFFLSAYCMIGMDWVFHLHFLLFYSFSPNKHKLQMKMWTESLTDLHETTWSFWVEKLKWEPSSP